MNTAVSAASTEFVFPKSYSFPPSSRRNPPSKPARPNFLSIVDALDTPLFYNLALKKRLGLKDVKEVIDYMASLEGDERAEWLSPEKASAWVWWRKPEEWAKLIAAWVEETGQKGVVLTLYELVQGEATERQEFYGLDMRILQRSLTTLVKKGKAQVFGTDDQQGVKFF